MDSVLRWTNLILFCIGVIVYIYGFFCMKGRTYRQFAQMILLFYVAHAALFYIVDISLLEQISVHHQFINTWSKVLRFHGAIALLTREIVGIINEKIYVK